MLFICLNNYKLGKGGGFICGLMGGNMMESIIMIKNKALEYIPGQMAVDMKEIG